MNLTELQKELRNLENKLSVLQNEIEEMKPKTEESKKQDFENITKLALKHPLENVAISEAPEHLIKKYISLLSLIMLSGEKAYNEKLLYLMRIVSSTEMHWTAEEVVQFGMELDEDEIEPICNEISEFSQGFISKTKYTFLADALILVNFAGEASHKEISLIADIAKILNVDRDDLHVISKVVCSYLTDDYAPLEGFIGNGKKAWGGVFKQYIPLSWLEKQRVSLINILLKGLSQYELYYIGKPVEWIKDVEPFKKRYELISFLSMTNINAKNGQFIPSKEILFSIDKKNLHFYEIYKNKNICTQISIFLETGGIVYGDKVWDIIVNLKSVWDENSDKYFEYLLSNEYKNIVKKPGYMFCYIVSIFDDFNDVREWFESKIKLMPDEPIFF